MGHSSLLGIDHAAQEAPGRDTASLGPGDNSDSGSDMAGLDDSDTSDPGMPVDVALRDDMPHGLQPSEMHDGSATDAAGTGERRSAGLDAGGREAADIGIDRVFSADGEEEEAPDDEDADLAFVDQAEVGDPLDEEEEDGDSDDVEDFPDNSPGIKHAGN